MIFLILFVLGGMIVPTLIDSRRHNGDNILRRSGRELLQLETTQSVLRLLRVTAENANAGAVALVSVGSAIVVLDVVYYVLRFLGRMIVHL